MPHPPTSAHTPTPSGGEWSKIEPFVLEDVRSPVPSFPLDLLPPFWREWTGGTARAVGAPADYVALSVLAAAAGLAGVGAQVRVTSRWVEPLVLWQAMVGAPSSGKSSAMAPVRDMLSALEPKPGAGGSNKPGRIVEDGEIAVVADALDAHPRGVMLWRDEAADLLARLGCIAPARPGDEVVRACWLKAWSADPVVLERGVRRFNRFAVSLMAALRPERLTELSRASEELASRFLFTWPHAPAHASLTVRTVLRDDEALVALRRLADRFGGTAESVILAFDDAALCAFDNFVAGLNAERRDADGLEAAWLGKGPSAVARLAGVLHLLAWSRETSANPSASIDRESIERAIALWSDYFRPHALALFHHELPSEQDRRTRQVVRWLRGRRQPYVSREDVRSKALHRAVNAHATDQILFHLQEAGVVEQGSGGPPSRGRPMVRWFVNPALFDQPLEGRVTPSGSGLN